MMETDLGDLMAGRERPTVALCVCWVGWAAAASLGGRCGWRGIS